MRKKRFMLSRLMALANPTWLIFHPSHQRPAMATIRFQPHHQLAQAEKFFVSFGRGGAS